MKSLKAKLDIKDKQIKRLQERIKLLEKGITEKNRLIVTLSHAHTKGD